METGGIPIHAPYCMDMDTSKNTAGTSRENHTVERVNEYGEAVLSTERAMCSCCGFEGWRGDWPGQGGVVHCDDGALLCDDCEGDR